MNNDAIERLKQQLNLTGEVYIYNEHYIENLESHKRLIPNSTATTIQEAYAERVAFEQERTERERQQPRRNREELYEQESEEEEVIDE